MLLLLLVLARRLYGLAPANPLLLLVLLLA
jgi:hypothetical protein